MGHSYIQGLWILIVIWILVSNFALLIIIQVSLQSRIFSSLSISTTKQNESFDIFGYREVRWISVEETDAELTEGYEVSTVQWYYQRSYFIEQNQDMGILWPENDLWYVLSRLYYEISRGATGKNQEYELVAFTIKTPTTVNN